MPFDPTRIGPDIDAYFAETEAQFTDIKPGTEKRVIWATAPGTRTDWVVVYIHGFSASSEEIRPVPDRIANELGANLVYTRLAGHGRAPDAMAEATPDAWTDDVTEALTAARAVGDRIIVISTSTGGTIVTALSQDTDVMEGVAGFIFVAPNYGINNPLAPLLKWPLARHWLPWIGGRRRTFVARSDRHATYWTLDYPSVAVMPMVPLIDRVHALDHGKQTIPALFWYAEQDNIVLSDRTRTIAAAWGAPKQTVHPALTDKDDIESHVVVGDILSPGQTDAAVTGMLDWIRGLD
ncbi:MULTISPECIES: carboxylesterase [Roseobacteraceae]|uniref:alpha/beta hydrolase n=1 Tax=Roseobacteraceae TaxID=2854170 RepID=UPI001C45A621|nr:MULTISPECIES: alpha/beta fold hydrolase [Roseobacteraceae]MBV7408871.1 lysophospholipase [Maritimibacter sp. DP1N21-5]MBY5934442.1 lysophospholipase [Tateyamaria omphalii]